MYQLIGLPVYISPIGVGNHLLPCNSTSFAPTLFTVANVIVMYEKSDKLGFKIRDRGSVRVSRVRIRVSCRVVWADGGQHANRPIH